MIFFCDHFALLARTLFSAIYPMTTVLDGAWPKDKTKKTRSQPELSKIKTLVQTHKSKSNQIKTRGVASRVEIKTCTTFGKQSKTKANQEQSRGNFELQFLHWKPNRCVT